MMQGRPPRPGGWPLSRDGDRLSVDTAAVRRRLRDEYLEVMHLGNEARTAGRPDDAFWFFEYGDALERLMLNDFALLTLALLDAATTEETDHD